MAKKNKCRWNGKKDEIFFPFISSFFLFRDYFFISSFFPDILWVSFVFSFIRVFSRREAGARTERHHSDQFSPVKSGVLGTGIGDLVQNNDWWIRWNSTVCFIVWFSIFMTVFPPCCRGDSYIEIFRNYNWWNHKIFKFKKDWGWPRPPPHRRGVRGPNLTPWIFHWEWTMPSPSSVLSTPSGFLREPKEAPEGIVAIYKIPSSRRNS